MSRKDDAPPATLPGDRPAVRRTSAPTAAPPATDHVSPPDHTLAAGTPPAPSTHPDDAAAPLLDLQEIVPSLYRVEGEQGRGGIGRVLRAHDRRLDRPVAIKQLLARPDDTTAARFVREALVTARLQHPGVVPVYEAGRWPGGEPFYAMKLIAGESLKDAIAARPTLAQRLALVPNVLAVAETIAYAHSQGVVHRDLKPGNVVLGPYGETMVVDWGLAKDLRRDDDEPVPTLYGLAHADQTRAGAVVGTPGYMPPEQARGEPVGEAADIYAIGALLYHALAAVPPYDVGGEAAVTAVLAGPPRPLAERVPDAPADLCAIVAKAMAREPAARYASAKGMAEDLSRFLTGQLVGARAYAPWTLALRWLRRHRLPVALALVAVIALAASGAVSARRIVRERNLARARSAQLVLTQARAALDRDPTESLAWLATYPDDGSDWLAAQQIASDALGRGVARHVLGPHAEPVIDLALSPDGRTLATGSVNDVFLWDVESGRRLGAYRVSAVTQLRFSPDGRTLAAAGDVLVLLDPAHVTAPTVLGRPDAWLAGLAWTPDGRELVTAGADGELRAWQVTAPGESRRLAVHEGGASALALGGGDVVFSTGGDGLLRRTVLAADQSEVLWSRPGGGLGDVVARADGLAAAVATGREIVLWEDGAGARPLVTHDAEVTALAMAGDGTVVSGSQDGVVAVSRPGRAPTTYRGHAAAIAQVLVAPDGTAISSDAGGDIRVWRDEVVVLRGHGQNVQLLAMDAAGRHLVSGSYDTYARVWTLPAPGRSLAVGAGDVFRLGFLDDTRVATTSRDGGVRIVDLGRGDVRELGRHGLAAYDLEVLADGRFVTGGWDGRVVVWSADDGERQRFEHGARVWAVAAAPQGDAVASAGADGDVRYWTLDGRVARVVAHHDSDAADVAFTPDGRRIVSTSADLVLRVSTLDGAARALPGFGDNAQGLTFVGDALFAVAWDGVVSRWDLDRGTMVALGRHEQRARTLARSPDGRWLASGSSDRTIRLWDAATGASSRTFEGHRAEVRHVVFSPDGRWLASAGWDGTVRVWNTVTGGGQVLGAHEVLVQRVAFSPDGHRLVSGGLDGRVRVWDVRDLGGPPAGPALRAYVQRFTTTEAPTGSGLRPRTTR